MGRAEIDSAPNTSALDFKVNPKLQTPGVNSRGPEQDKAGASLRALRIESKQDTGCELDQMRAIDRSMA